MSDSVRNMGGTSRRRALTTVSMIGFLPFLLCACAELRNTPEQDLALSRWNACQSPTSGAQLNRVEPDGRISFWTYGPGARQPMLDCLRRAAKDGPALPEPVAEPRPGGGGGGGGM